MGSFVKTEAGQVKYEYKNILLQFILPTNCLETSMFEDEAQNCLNDYKTTLLQ